MVVVKSRWDQQWRRRALWNTSNKLSLYSNQARRHDRVWKREIVPQQYMQPSGLIDAPFAKPAKKIPPVFTVSFVGPRAYVDSQEKKKETIPRSSSSQTSHYTDWVTAAPWTNNRNNKSLFSVLHCLYSPSRISLLFILSDSPPTNIATTDTGDSVGCIIRTPWNVTRRSPILLPEN
jgi:hypothetical protein